MITSDSYRIRPAGRHILTIGRDLIQDNYAAIVELVKNAYDADSNTVEIEFAATEDQKRYTITVNDKGHGMSRDTVVSKWMVPSTDDKLKRKVSPRGRVMQGRKGVGRYASSVLGDELLLETVTESGEKTTLLVQWDQFEHAEYLEDVELLIETIESGESSGTRLTITGDSKQLREWDQTQFKKLKFELKKLISPVDSFAASSQPEFKILMSVSNFPDVEEMIVKEHIEPYPIFDLYDYRISGTVETTGKGDLTYSTQKARNTIEERITFDLGASTGCGTVNVDIRVYDRERDAIESLIERGLKDESGNYVGKLQARQLLNEYNGIGVYRNGFRIRPLGDAEFDWLKLNEQRVQNPSVRIGSNQVIGYVKIEAEEQSGLIEKSARDGLKENAPFERLKAITKSIISKLEEKRYSYRKTAGLSRSTIRIERQLEKLFAFDELKEGIKFQLEKGSINAEAAGEIIEIISKEETEKNKIADDIRKAVAIYQGQATLGKIINVILHEGRRPLNYFKNQIPNLQYLLDKYSSSKEEARLQEFMAAADGVAQNADIFAKLFGRLDPLAAGKRSEQKYAPLKKTIEAAFEVFAKGLTEQGITLKITGKDDFMYFCWSQDIYAIFTNLIDNSLFWMKEKNTIDRSISVVIESNANTLEYIDYRDTGPGIEPTLIISEAIFDPEFSTKPTGTGLGLAISGEAANRNGLELVALESTIGAYFRLQPKEK